VDITAHGESSPAGRRRFLRAVGLGGALSALPVALRRADASHPLAAAATTTSTATTTAEATTTAAPVVAAPTKGDVALLVYAQSIELAAVALYAKAGETLAGEPVVTAQVVDVFGAHHQAYVDALSGLLGRKATNTTNAALVEKLTPKFSAADTIVEAAMALEESATATHLDLLAKLEGTDAAGLVSSIMIVEGRHAVALAGIAGGDTLPTEAIFSAKSALKQSDYPVEG